MSLLGGLLMETPAFALQPPQTLVRDPRTDSFYVVPVDPADETGCDSCQ